MCGWLTKSSARDEKYCHLAAFREIGVNSVGSLEPSRQSMQMKIDTPFGDWKRKARARARAVMHSARRDHG